jgi:hypothetical protein
MASAVHNDYEYAGFHYQILHEGGDRYTAMPLPEQHKAVWKDKHRRAAVECFKADTGRA